MYKRQGIIRIAEDGTTAQLLWGYKDGGKFTSELPAHLMSHMARLSVDKDNRVVIHSHPTNTLAMNYVHELDEKKFTHTLWEMCTECIVVFPDGVGILPWMLCGTNEIGEATAEKMKEFRLVIWAMHGIYGAGKTLDETFGLIETVEKAAQIYMLTAGLERKNTIKDEDMIKLAVATTDLQQIGTQIELSNTYHLHVRPGDKIIKQLGGLHKFMNWNKPILTDSGGFQVFSLAGLRKIKEEGVTFQSHIDGHKIFMGPEESMQIQSNLGSTIAMAFDECAPAKADRKYIQNSVDRTYRWLERCKKEMARLNSLPDTVNPEQMLFGIDQGGVFNDIRIDHAKRISELDLDGYAVGGLAVGETHEEMYDVLDNVVPYLPKDKPTYLMGVGTPANILEAVDRGIDFFDCVYPSRNGRHGHVYTCLLYTSPSPRD